MDHENVVRVRHQVLCGKVVRLHVTEKNSIQSNLEYCSVVLVPHALRNAANKFSAF